MTKLFFRYSDIYNRQLSQWFDQKFTAKDGETVANFTKKLQDRWNVINDEVFSFFEKLGFFLPDYWFAYPVKNFKKVVPFSDPMTIPIHHDLDWVLSTVVHEFTHVEMSHHQNFDKISKKILDHLSTKFKDESRGTVIHIAVNVLEMAALKKVMPDQATVLIEKEKSIVGLRRAWEIIDSAGDIDLEHPLESLLKLYSFDK